MISASFICPTEEALFGFAGLWERWSKVEGEHLDTFTIITTAANGAILDLHDRMPVILQPEDYGLWLTRDTEPDLVRQLIAPCPDAMVHLHPVSKAVGNVRNEGPQLIEPLPS